MDTSEHAVICTLAPAGADLQLDGWQQIRSRAISVSRVGDGAVLRLPRAMEASVDKLAAIESECCSWLTLTKSDADGDLWLKVTSAHPAGRAIIADACGIAER